MHKQQGWPQAWEYSQAKLIQTLGRASQGVDWSWSQCITTLRRLQEKGYQATSEPETTSEASYLGEGEKELDFCSVVQSRAVRYDDIYRMEEIKSLSFHIMLYRLFRGVAKYIVYAHTFHHLDDCDLYTPPRGVKGRRKQVAPSRSTISQDKTRSSFLNEGLHL